MSELPFLQRYPAYRIESQSALFANERWLLRPEKIECVDPDNVTLACNSVNLDQLVLSVATSTGYRAWKYDPDNFTLFLVLTGDFLVESNRKAKTLRDGEAVLIPPGRRVTSLKDASVAAFLTIRAQPLVSKKRMQSLPLVFIERGRSLSRITVALLEDLSSRPNLPSMRAIGSWEALLGAEILDALNSSGALQEQTREASLRQVKEAEDYIADRLDGVLAVGAIADHLGISSRSLQLAFRRHRDTSPHQYIARERLAKVRLRLLQAHGGDTVTNIALGAGIASLGRFAKHYRDTYGEKPSETLAHALRRNGPPERRRASFAETG